MGGGRGRRDGRERGADLRYNMEISLEEAFTGKTAQVRLPTSVACEVLLRHRRQGRLASRRPVRIAAAPAASATRRASSRWSAPAPAARAAAR